VQLNDLLPDGGEPVVSVGASESFFVGRRVVVWAAIRNVVDG
jgi:hypothetical protein